MLPGPLLAWDFTRLSSSGCHVRGELAHPCSGVVAPIPGLISVQKQGDGLYFPEIDLTLSQALIAGFPKQRLYKSPGGHDLELAFVEQAFPVAVIDPAELLRTLAEQAAHAGAELSYSTAATGLLMEGNRVSGVRTSSGDVRASIVLSAEGTARHLCEEAGLYAPVPTVRRYAYVVSQELEAPAVKSDHLGQIITLGQRYSSAQEGFGTVVMPAPGRAWVYFTVFTDRPKDITVQSCWAYLDEYLQNDPRVRDLFVGSRIVSRAGQRMVIHEHAAEGDSRWLHGAGGRDHRRRSSGHPACHLLRPRRGPHCLRSNGFRQYIRRMSGCLQSPFPWPDRAQPGS